MSQTPLWQTSGPTAPAFAVVHCPLRTMGVWAPSVGTGTPFASWGVQTCRVSLHQLPAVQSVSTAQPQMPVVVHTPERHAAGFPVQELSPLASPHALSLGSQIPVTQTMAPAPAVHTPSRCDPGMVPVVGSVGMAVPLASFAMHRWAPSLHHCAAVQSGSTLQPFIGSHLPLVLHVAERHSVGFPVPLQGPSPTA